MISWFVNRGIPMTLAVSSFRDATTVLEKNAASGGVE
jgi:hypothetical protein